MEAELVRALVERWAAAVRARDVEAVLRSHAADLLMFDVIGPVAIRGIEEYKQTWVGQFFPWHGGSGRFDLVDLQVSAGHDVAFATALIDCAGTEDGAMVHYRLRLTIGLEKHRGEWTVVHEHHSQPLDFDTMRIGGGAARLAGNRGVETPAPEARS